MPCKAPPPLPSPSPVDNSLCDPKGMRGPSLLAHRTRRAAGGGGGHGAGACRWYRHTNYELGTQHTLQIHKFTSSQNLQALRANNPQPNPGVKSMLGRVRTIEPLLRPTCDNGSAPSTYKPRLLFVCVCVCVRACVMLCSFVHSSSPLNHASDHPAPSSAPRLTPRARAPEGAKERTSENREQGA